MQVIPGEPVGSAKLGDLFAQGAFFLLQAFGFGLTGPQLYEEAFYERGEGRPALSSDYLRSPVGIVVQ